MKRVLAKLAVFAGTVVLVACANPGVPVPPSLEVPTPVRDLRAVRKGDNVYLSWTVPTRTTEQQSVRHAGTTRVCRSLSPVVKQCGIPVKEFLISAPKDFGKGPTPTTATYVDTLPITPNVSARDEITYGVEVLNNYSRSAGLSNQVKVSLLPALPPPDGFRAEIAADGVHISWTCPSSNPSLVQGLQYRVRVFRHLEGTQTDINAGEGGLTACQQPQVVDQGFEWGKSYEYHASVITVSSEDGHPQIEVEGDDTPTVKVVAHDTFPPAAPLALQAVFSGAGQQPFIDLVWTPNTEADLAGYSVYRHEEGKLPVKINADLVKAPAYRDTHVQSGKSYFYSIAAVDLRGNQSALSDEANEAVP